MRPFFPQVSFAHWFQPIHHLGEKNPFLDVRRQQCQVDQLRDPCPGHAKAARHLRTVAHDASVDGLLDLVRERQQDGHSSGLANWFWRYHWLGGEPLCVAFAAAVELAGDDRAAVQCPIGCPHALASATGVVASGAPPVSAMNARTSPLGSSTSTRKITARINPPGFRC
jgi:hypothetical protein